MNIKQLMIFVGLLVISLYLTGCEPLQTELDTEASPVAVNLAATQTAAAPISTPTLIPPTDTPIPPTGPASQLP